MEDIKKYKDIEPDTSKYLNPVNKGVARAKCAEAQREGSAVEMTLYDGVWVRLGTLDFGGAESAEYRVKPTPVITEKTEWHLYVPRGGVTMRSKDNFVDRFACRALALVRAEAYLGWALIDQVQVTYEDGKEVSRCSEVSL